jgi:branched-chain amino acid transport system ATP-binding protein
MMIWKPRGLVSTREPSAFLKERKAVSGDLVGRATADALADDPLLTVEHLTMRFGGLLAVNDLSFEARRGDITALIGPNGAGKTTVFNCITGFYKPTRAASPRAGAPMPTSRRRRHRDRACRKAISTCSSACPTSRSPEAKVARTFQNIRLFPA